MTQYIIYGIFKDELKEAAKTCKEIYGIVDWNHIPYILAQAPLYIIETKEAAIKHVRYMNRTSNNRIYFYIELSTYKN